MLVPPPLYPSREVLKVKTNLMHRYIPFNRCMLYLDLGGGEGSTGTGNGTDLPLTLKTH